MNTPQNSGSLKTAGLSRLGVVFLIIGMIGLGGSWAITEPTVEKINMVAGAFLFFGLFALTLVLKLQRQCEQLQNQIDEFRSNAK